MAPGRSLRPFAWGIAALVGVLSVIAVLLRIFVAGEPTTGYTSVVLLKFDDRQCSGVVVGTRMVLTAAHCMESDRKPEVVIQGHQAVSVESCVPHPQYEYAPQFDIGLCRLRNAALVSPHPLSVSGSLSANRDVSYVGYGECLDVLAWFVKEPSRTYGQGTVSRIQDNVVRIKGDWVCGGDSGSPVFAALANEHYPVSAVISAIGPRAWPVSESRTSKWLKEYAAELCLEGGQQGACQPGPERQAHR